MFNKKKNALQPIIVIVVTGCVLLTIAVLLSAGTADLSELLMVIAALGLCAGALFLAKDKISALRKGLPTEDELSKKVTHKAAAYSYYFTIWLSIAIMWLDMLFFEDMLGHGLRAGQIVGMIVIFSGIFFIVTAILFRKYAKV